MQAKENATNQETEDYNHNCFYFYSIKNPKVETIKFFLFLYCCYRIIVSFWNRTGVTGARRGPYCSSAGGQRSDG